MNYNKSRSNIGLETKLFSEVKKNKTFSRRMLETSVSSQDAENRTNQLDKLFSNYNEFQKIMKNFSSASYADNQVMTSQYFNATVAANVNSFAGFWSVERAIDAPKALFYFLDMLGVTDNRVVLPNLGQEDLSGIKNAIRWENTVVAGTSTYSNAFGKRIVPTGVRVIVTDAAGTKTVGKDDGKGVILMAPGILANATIDYQTGLVEVEFTAAVAAGSTVEIQAVHNQTGENNVNRFKTDMSQIMLETFPEVLVAEHNLASIAAMTKTLGTDPSKILVSKLTEVYTKKINSDFVQKIAAADISNEFLIDLNSSSFDNYASQIDKFSGQLANVNSRLAVQSVKGVRATAYLVGTAVGTYFEKTENRGHFKAAPTSYVNDLIGYYKGIPVMQSTELPEDVGYAGHKTVDGNLAPLGRGMFLPLTSTPQVGNFENPTQVADGVYYQEENKAIAPELIQKFKITNHA